MRHQIELIGREKEMDELKRHLAEALASRGSTILISGEPGIGKTRLIEAFEECAAAQPFLVFSKALGGEMDAPLFEEQVRRGCELYHPGMNALHL